MVRRRSRSQRLRSGNVWGGRRAARGGELDPGDLDLHRREAGRAQLRIEKSPGPTPRVGPRNGVHASLRTVDGNDVRPDIRVVAGHRDEGVELTLRVRHPDRQQSDLPRGGGRLSLRIQGSERASEIEAGRLVRSRPGVGPARVESALLSLVATAAQVGERDQSNGGAAAHSPPVHEVGLGARRAGEHHECNEDRGRQPEPEPLRAYSESHYRTLQKSTNAR